MALNNVGLGFVFTARDLASAKMAQLERAFVIEALSRTGGVQAQASRLLGITERSIWHLVKKHRIEVEKIKERTQA